MEEKLEQVGKLDPSLMNSPITDEKVLAVAEREHVCIFNDKKYSYGARVCGEGIVLTCTISGWSTTKESC